MVTVIYLSRGAPLVSSVVVPVEVHHATVLQSRALLPTLCKGLSPDGSQGFLQTFPGLLAETLERQRFDSNSETPTSLF